MTPDILAAIAEYKRREVAERKGRLPTSELEARIAAMEPPRGFASALRRHRPAGGLALIAEVKKASPSKGLIREDFDPAQIAAAYAEAGAACLSVLTDAPSFQGSEAYLTAAREAAGLPCLRKDFMVDPWQVAESRAIGADAILVILAMVDDSLAADLMAEAARYGMDVLVETHDAQEISRAAALGAELIGVNNRDLRTFVTDLAVTEALAPKAPPNCCLVTESGIFTAADAARMARAGASAMLVGESLMRQPDVAAATRALLASNQVDELDTN
jgi:indole-3-glycerol phosphate synthase